ncbi:MAG TPA: hypothetical protein VI386_31975 [Candidatus Sulfotelmatobacter sp.]
MTDEDKKTAQALMVDRVWRRAIFQQPPVPAEKIQADIRELTKRMREDGLNSPQIKVFWMFVTARANLETAVHRFATERAALFQTLVELEIEPEVTAV